MTEQSNGSSEPSTTFKPYKGSAFLMETGGAGQRHLFITITENDPDDEYILACVSSYREGRFFDSTCPLDENDHDFLRHCSFVDYRHCRVIDSRRMALLVNSWMAIQHKDAAMSVVERIANGVLLSQFSNNYLKKAFRRAR